MDRDTTTINTSNHSFTVKTYATAKEHNAIQSAYFKGARVEVVGQEPKISEFDPSVQYHVQLEMIRQLVIDMDNSKDKIIDRCENLPTDEFDDLSIQLDGLISKKKTSEPA